MIVSRGQREVGQAGVAVFHLLRGHRRSGGRSSAGRQGTFGLRLLRFEQHEGTGGGNEHAKCKSETYDGLPYQAFHGEFLLLERGIGFRPSPLAARDADSTVCAERAELSASTAS